MQRTSRETTVYPITIRELEVLRTQDVTPGMRRVILGGAGLAEHERNGVHIPPFRSTGFDDDVKIIVPDPVTGLCPIPEPQPGGTVAWTEEAVALARTYTVRSFDAEAGELAIDFVLHGTGLASSWSRKVEPGASIYLAGPKVSAALPTDTDWMLLVGDDTALPAIARCLEEVPEGTRVRAVVEVPTARDRQELKTAADLELTWVVREAGEDLVETVKELQWWEGDPFVWVAGEAMAIKPLRRWLKQERSVPREHTDISGYWRQREVVSVEDDAATVDVAATGPSAEARLHEMTELAPALAVRTACALGIFALVDEGTCTVHGLAERTETNPQALARFLRMLAVHDLLVIHKGVGTGTGTDTDDSSEADCVELSEMGQLLSDPDARMVRSLSRSATIAELSLAGLERALRHGGPVPVDTENRTWEQIRADRPALAEESDEFIGEEAWFTAPALPGVVGFTPGETVAFTGPGAGVYADEAIRRVDGFRAILTGSPEACDRALREIAPERREAVERVAATAEPNAVGKVETADAMAPGRGMPGGRTLLPETTTLVAIDPFGTMPSNNHSTHVAALLHQADRVVVVSALVDETAPDEFDLEEDIRRLCLYGGELPSRKRLAQVVADAGGIVTGLKAVGWGLWAIELAVAGNERHR